VDKEDEIIKRLDVLINLTLKQQKAIPATKKNMESIVKMFLDMGIDDYKEIARIIETKNPVSVANILTRLKGTKGSRKKKKSV
jgi:hypothetical protein